MRLTEEIEKCHHMGDEDRCPFCMRDIRKERDLLRNDNITLEFLLEGANKEIGELESRVKELEGYVLRDARALKHFQDQCNELKNEKLTSSK